MAAIPSEIRIESKTDAKGGSFVSVQDADTGEQLPNIASILIRLVRDDVVMADIYFDNGAVMRRIVKDIAVTISSDALPVAQVEEKAQ